MVALAWLRVKTLAVNHRRMAMAAAPHSFAPAAERFVRETMAKNDASHDASHVLRVRNLALELAKEEGLIAGSSLRVVELAALLHDVDDHKYVESSQQNRVGKFLDDNGVDDETKRKVTSIIKSMGFKEQLSNEAAMDQTPELAVVQDADRLDAIGAIGIARCFTYGGSRNHILHDPSILPVLDGMTKEEYTRKDRKNTMVNHFYEKLLKLKELMKTEAGRRRAEKRHQFMEAYLQEFFQEWDGFA